MDNSTQVAASRAITVPFHGADLYVVEHNGEPYTPMKPIVEGMGLTWQPQHRKLAANQVRWGITELVIPSAGGSQAMTCAPLRKLPGWMFSVEVGKVKASEVRARVIQYQNECDDVLWQYWNDGLAINPRALYSVNPGDVLTKEEADTLRKMVEGMAKKLSADTKVQGKFILQAWSKLKSHFKVSYREIPRQELTEAISIINRHTVEWELMDEAPKASQEPTMPELVEKMVEWVNAPNGYPVHLFVPVYEAIHARLQRGMEVPRIIDATDAPAMAQARKVAMDYFADYRAAVKCGKSLAEMDAIPSAALQGMIADAIMRQRMLISFDQDTGRMGCTVVPSDASVFSFATGNYTDLINGIPMQRLPELADSLNRRVASHLGAFSERLKRA